MSLGQRQKLQTALSLHQRGQLIEAIKIYDQVLFFAPDDFDAMHLKGLALYQTGRADDAIRLLTKAIQKRPTFAQVYNNRGLALQASGKREDALRDFGKALQLKRDYAEAIYNKGNVLRELGRLGEAAEAYAQALALNPAIPEIYNSIGVLNKDLTAWPEAIRNFEKALSLRPGYLDAMVNLANALREVGAFDAALEQYDKALKLHPAHAEASNNRGNVLRELGRREEALASFDRAIALKPAYAEAHFNRGNALKEFLRLNEALESYDKAIALKPDYAEAYISRGSVLREQSRADEAVASFEKAISLNPGHVIPWIWLARIDSEMGNFAEAERKYQRARELDPTDVQSLCGISELRKFDKADPLIADIERLLQDERLNSEDRGRLHHAYGKILNDLGSYDDAFCNFVASKTLMASKFSMSKHVAGYDAIKSVFTPAFFAERSDFGVAEERPVFIVGMPRSGTTLVEQIISSHPLADGLGELPDMPQLMAALGGGLAKPQQLREAVLRLSAAESRRMAGEYLDMCKRGDQSCIRFVDKRPHNYECLGLIALLFPKAHIIHCRRDPMDTCVSIFMQNFNESHGYNQNLETLGAYYLAYEDLMAHWSRVLPVAMHECVYEKVVSDLEGSARALIAAVGLAWDPACLNYHETERRVSTPSRWQVRQPLYDKSIGRWRRYEGQLGPLTKALQPK